MKIPGPIFVFSVATLLLSACASRPASRPAETSARGTSTTTPRPVEVLRDLKGTAWILIELEGEAVGLSPVGWSPLSLAFDEEGVRVSGHAGVNRFGARYEADRAALRFGPLAMTRRAGPEALMAREQVYTRVLSQTVGWRQEGERLILLTPGERRAAVLSRVQASLLK
jgi:heat shock protein HslJ